MHILPAVTDCSQDCPLRFSKFLSLLWNMLQACQELGSCCPNTVDLLEELKIFMAMTSYFPLMYPIVLSLQATPDCQHFYIFLFTRFYEDWSFKQ